MALSVVPSSSPPPSILQVLEDRDWPALEAMLAGGFPPNASWGEHGSLFERFVLAASLPAPPIPQTRSHQAQMQALEALIQAGLSPTPPPGGDSGGLPLAVSALAGRPDFVRRLLDDAHAPNGVGPSRHTPLSLLALRTSPSLGALAVEFSRIRACVDELIEGGAEVNQPAAGNWLPLTLAASVKDYEMVKLLLEHGALVNGRASGIPKQPGPRYAAVCWAIHHDDERLLKLLLDHGASLTPSMSAGVNVVDAAGERAGPDVWRVLAGRLGLDASPVRRGWFRAVAHNRHLLVLWFLCAGMSATQRSEEGWGPLDVACEHEALDIIPLLVSAGASPSRLAQDGVSPLSRLRKKTGRKALEKVGWGVRSVGS